MFYKAFAAIIFIISLIDPSYQQQNLCGSNPNFSFVPDPSTCHTYLRCHDRNSEGFSTRFSIGSCYQLYGTGSNFFVMRNETGTCSLSSTNCANPLLMCPPVSEPDIMIADPLDRDCRRHRPCRALTAGYASCPLPLIFNRNTGMCDLPANAPCADVLLPPRCPTGATGFFPGGRCFEYIYCISGEILLNLECKEGMYFNEAAESCLFDTDNNCSRPASLMDFDENPERIEE